MGGLHGVRDSPVKVQGPPARAPRGRKRDPIPTHPRERHWFAAGVAQGADGRRKRPTFPLRPRELTTGSKPLGGGSYYERYKACFEAGFVKGKKLRGASDEGNSQAPADG